MLLFLAIIVVVAIWGVWTYNRGVRLRNLVEESWSGISVQLKRRYDLIPNLVNTVKGYARHEQATLEQVINLRNQAQGVPAGDVAGKAQAEQALSAGLRSVFALAESYPDLKANTNFLSLQESLTEVEDNLQNARRYYNAVVRDNNTYVETIPSMFVARMGGFQTYSYFEIEDQERQNVRVEF